MATNSAQVAVTSSAASIFAGIGIGSGGLFRATIKNSGANPVQIGGSGVTTANGYTIANGDAPLTITLSGDDVLFAVSALGSTLQVLVVGEVIGA